MQRHLPRRRQQVQPSLVADARKRPCARERGMIPRDPRVVVVGEQMNLRFGDGCREMRDDRPRQQQIAELVALDDQDAHARGRFR